MDQDFVTHVEFNAELKRLNDEDIRQNHRITNIENDVKAIKDLTVSVEKMAVNMGYMKDEVSNMREDIESIKNIPASRWDKLISGIIGAAAGVIGAALIAAIIHFL